MPPANLTARYVALAQKLGAECGHARGWRRRAAERLGISESTLSKILSGTRVVGMDLAERAIERLSLQPGYFWAEEPGSGRQPRPDEIELKVLLDRFNSRTADAADVYCLAHLVAENPAVMQAQKILKIRQPKSEKELGALFLEVSRLIDLLNKKPEH